jgi:hypothetical protein
MGYTPPWRFGGTKSFMGGKRVARFAHTYSAIFALFKCYNKSDGLARANNINEFSNFLLSSLVIGQFSKINFLAISI